MPLQVPAAEVLSMKRVGAYYALTVVAPGIPELTRPGHFLAVQVGGPDSAMLLRRAFAIYDVKERGVYGGTVDVVFSVHGKGTAWLATRRPGDRLDVVGPLGKPYRLPKEPVHATLVGGGYGSAPLLPLAAALRERGCRVDVVLGAGSSDRLFGLLEAKRRRRLASPSRPTTAPAAPAAGSATCCPASWTAAAPRSSTPAARCRCCAPSPTSPPSAACRRRSPSRSRWPAASASA